MLNLALILSVCVDFILLLGLSSRSPQRSATSMPSGDYSVRSGPLAVTLDPRVGGTIDSLMFDGYEFLTCRDVHPSFYGSTFWPSPQSDWNWPPPSVLSAEPYDARISGDTLVLVSGKDRVTGFQFRKEVYPGKNGSIRLRYIISNISDSSKSVAPWEITRVRKGGLLFFPVGSNPLGKKSFDPVSVRIKDGIAWYKDSRERPADNLLTTADGEEGWAAYAIDGRLFLKRFPNVKPDELAPGEGEITVYVSGVADYIEFEIQGKYEFLSPGESSAWEAQWICAYLPKDLEADEGNSELVDFARRLGK